MTAEQIQRAINANSAEQSQLYQDEDTPSYAKTSKLHGLREQQKALYARRDQARLDERGIVPTRLH